MRKTEKLKRLTALTMTVFMIWSSIIFNCCTAFADVGLYIPKEVLSSPKYNSGNDTFKTPDIPITESNDQADETSSDRTEKYPVKSDSEDMNDVQDSEDIPTETEIEPYYAPPVLTFNPISDKWVRDFSGWNLKAEPIDGETITIYYKTRPQGQLTDWGSYTDSDAVEWDGNPPSGSNSIRFWAVSSNEKREVFDSVADYPYNLDNVPPEKPEVSTEIHGFIFRSLYLIVSNIFDEYSGVSGVYYTGEKVDDLLNKTENEISNDRRFQPVLNFNYRDGRKSFIINLGDEDKNKVYTVVVFDKLGNMSIANSGKIDNLALPDKLNYSLVRPESDTDVKNVITKDVYSTDSDVTKEYYYVNDNDTLLVRAVDDNPDSLYVVVKGNGSVTDPITGDTKEVYVKTVAPQSTDITYYEPYEDLIKEFHKNDPEDLTDTITATDTDKSADTEETKIISRGSAYFSIPIAYIASKLKLDKRDSSDSDSTDNVYTLKITVEDGTGSATDTISRIFYDPDAGGRDCLIEETYSGSFIEGGNKVPRVTEDGTIDKYFFSPDSNNNKVGFSFKDDVGLRKALIKIKDPDGLSSSIPYSIAKSGQRPETERKAELISLSKNGLYIFEITVMDLAGNTRSKEMRFFVDNAPPTIERISYENSRSLFSYLTLGLFGKESITISVDASDFQNEVDGVGIDPEDVVLEWDYEKYTADYVNGMYVFSSLDPKKVDKTETKYSKPTITVSDRLGNTSKYYLCSNKDYSEGNELESDELTIVKDEASGVTLVLEAEAPVFTVQPFSKSNYVLIPDNNGKNKLIFGEPNENQNKLVFNFSDNVGISSYTISVFESETNKEIQSFTWDATPDFAVKDTKYTFTLPDLATGRYEIETTVTDLAGNVTIIPYLPDFSYNCFYIDNEAPEILDSEYEVKYSPLHYLSFGIFGNSEIDLWLKVVDGKNGSGSSTATLYWNGAVDGKKIGDATEDIQYDTYSFSHLAPNRSGFPYIVVTDRLGNVNVYYFTATEKNKGSSSNQIGQLILENASSPSVKLTLENIAPEIDIAVNGSYKVYNIDGQDWYGDEITYNVTAKESVDVAQSQAYSGLNHIAVYENDSKNAKYTLTDYKCSDTDVDFSKVEYNETAKYSFEVSKEGAYSLSAIAFDNAGNSSTASTSFSIDTTNPEVVRFVFNTENEYPPYIKRETYGYFFQKETEIRVYVRDNSVSAGIDRTVLYLLSSQDDGVEVKTVYDTDLKTDADGVYAEYTIPVGFKGQLGAEVIDRVERTSDVKNPDGSIIEDERIHKDTSSIEIKENITTENIDANEIPLYNREIPLTITVSDTFSGLETIEWSIANDDVSGVIAVNKKGEISNNSDRAEIDGEKTVRDSNLVTTIQFTLTVTSNTNGNNVTVKFKDRAGNTGEAEKTYSIDTTDPIIEAALSNTSPLNEYYYNTDQTVTITITERNFNADDVSVILNGSEQPVNWSGESGKTLGDDKTEHRGSFRIDSDGRYEFRVNYTDLAGNRGDSYTQPLFVIDKVAPSITNNFADFGSPDDKAIFINSEQQKNTFAKINVSEINFNEGDMHVQVFYKDSGSEHSDGHWKEYYVSFSWNTDRSDASKHNLVIPFENDGVYMVRIDPVDRAGNKGVFEMNDETKRAYPSQTAIFETDYTAPVISERDGMLVEANDTSFCGYYDFDRRSDPSPTVMFSDINISSVDCEVVKYIPAYRDGHNLGEIKPNNENYKITEISSGSTDSMLFTLGSFDNDGIYSVKLTAADKAGNVGTLVDNTYVRMVDPENKVLAYIENSDKEKGEGWYSFENDNGPISKQPESFKDLSIVVFSKKSEASHIYLTDKDTSVKTDTGITSDPGSVFDDSMFSIHGSRYILPGDYFSSNYSADADTHLFLQVENTGAIRDIGEIYIDNSVPTCTIPKHFKNWGWISGSGDKTLLFEDVSEELDQTKTVAYIDGVETKLDSDSVFSYSEDANERTLSLTLSPGSHSVGLVMVDKAGNEGKVNEVSHLAIGNSRIWISVSSVLGTLLVAIIAMILTKHRNNSRIKK